MKRIQCFTYLKLGLGETVMAETEQGTEAQKHAAAPPKTQKRRREENDKHIAELFHLLDIDRSGGISLRELVTGLSGPKVVEMIQLQKDTDQGSPNKN